MPDTSQGELKSERVLAPATRSPGTSVAGSTERRSPLRITTAAAGNIRSMLSSSLTVARSCAHRKPKNVSVSDLTPHRSLIPILYEHTVRPYRCRIPVHYEQTVKLRRCRIPVHHEQAVRPSRWRIPVHYGQTVRRLRRCSQLASLAGNDRLESTWIRVLRCTHCGSE